MNLDGLKSKLSEIKYGSGRRKSTDGVAQAQIDELIELLDELVETLAPEEPS